MEKRRIIPFILVCLFLSINHSTRNTHHDMKEHPSTIGRKTKEAHHKQKDDEAKCKEREGEKKEEGDEEGRRRRREQ